MGTFPSGTIGLTVRLSFIGLRKGLLRICDSDTELCARGKATPCLAPSLPDPPALSPTFPSPLLPPPPFSPLLLLSPNQGKKDIP